MKLFISQPMRGRTDEEILEERNRIIDTVQDKFPDKDIEVIESFMQGAPHDAKPLWFLGKSIQYLSEADVAYFAKGWLEARGCKIENISARDYGIEVIEE